MQQEITVLEIDWSETVGSIARVGSPYLFGWLRAAYIHPGMIADGQVTVLVRSSREEDWCRWSGPISESEAVTLVCMLAGIGIPDRRPRIAPVPDTSDTLYSGTVRITVGQRDQMFTVQTQCSGFRGADADGLRSVMQRVVDLAGCDRNSSLFTSTGEPHG